MSTINKKPYIASVLETLTNANLTTLRGLLNGSNKVPLKRSLLNGDLFITNDDKNKVQFISLEVEGNVYSGYLIYNATYCVLVSFDNEYAQPLKMLKIDLAKLSYEIVDEFLNIDEFRNLVEDKYISENALPDVGENDKNKYLHTNAETGNPEWSEVETFNANVNIADEYDDTHTYNTGDLAIHENILYMCNDDSITGTWNSAKWVATNIANAVLGLLNTGI